MKDLKIITFRMKDTLDKLHRQRFILAGQEEFTLQELLELNLLATSLQVYAKRGIEYIHLNEEDLV